MTKILLVEDDKSLREIYGVRLLAEGYDIVSAGDGEEALAMSIKERPQLIISDVMMPKISGFDMLDILRSTTETRGIKVIMMTALSTEDQRARGEALGADRYLVKSQVGIEDVVNTVHEILEDKDDYPSQTAPSAAQVPHTEPSTQAVMPQPSQSSPTIQHAYNQSDQPKAPHLDTLPAQPSSQLPQPTAPFSTNRPANLADRIIHPLERTGNEPDMNSLIAQELSFHESSSADESISPEPSQSVEPPVETGTDAPNHATEVPTQSEALSEHEPATLAEALAQLNGGNPTAQNSSQTLNFEETQRSQSSPQTDSSDTTTSPPDSTPATEQAAQPQSVTASAAPGPAAPTRPFFGPSPDKPFVPGPQPTPQPQQPSQPPQQTEQTS